MKVPPHQEVGDCTEQKRLNVARRAGGRRKARGPCLSERQAGTVREQVAGKECG
ncbi:MAG TPA: hypothetical protein VFQ51_16375 [Vicinamibacteria bacterium]|nr:hypothetical protein [Vicinamibacteria bacterium]